MNQITINGKLINVPNGSVVISNGEVYVNGQRYTDNTDDKTINIVIEGNCESLKVDHCQQVEVKGDVRGTVDAGGAVVVHGNVLKNVDAGGSVNCGDVGGDVDAGGNVNCGDISGDVDAGGNVFRK